MEPAILISLLYGVVWGALWGILDGTFQKKGILVGNGDFFSGLLRAIVCSSIGYFVALLILGPLTYALAAIVPALLLSIVLEKRFKR